MDPITAIVLLIIAGILIVIAVHHIPVGGAPAAMAMATGVGTGTVQLATGAGLTGLVSAGYMYHFAGVDPYIVLLSGGIGSTLMIGITMLIGNVIYIFGVGVPPVSAKVKFDPITKDRQDIYVSPGTEGHGIPTVSFVSGIIGGFIGGVGGSLTYVVLNEVGINPAISAFIAIGFFIANAVIAAYNIAGTIEGFHDPKFKRLPKAILSSLIVSGFIAAVVIGGVFL
ncbi:MAG: tetrahydromethanopterin S-methyltransferase subunit D [Archaeoglobales archaeon]|nr:tetrahydromethanopterin S-methyltransferase subunit D [Archaeoglobales archaeon]